MDLLTILAKEVGMPTRAIAAAVALLDEGATVPFIARYRKEKTAGMSDIQLRLLVQRYEFWRDLLARREVILQQIQAQGQLSPALEYALYAAQTKTELEDLYLPYRPKRRTKAQQAREAGLQALADALYMQTAQSPEQLATPFLCEAVPTVADALAGAQAILIEKFSEDASLLQRLREQLWKQAWLHGEVKKGKEAEAYKFKDYFSYAEPLSRVPSHRALALLRGESEGFLKITLRPAKPHLCEDAEQKIMLGLADYFNLSAQAQQESHFLWQTLTAAWQDKLLPHLSRGLIDRLREQSEQEAARVFAQNLRDLLLAPPAGGVVTMGLDPGIRTGVKMAVVDSAAQVLYTSTIYPHPPRNDWQASISALAKACQQYQVQLIAVGNGTASRETLKLVQDMLKQKPALSCKLVTVSESGASIYSASELASQELPSLDVSLRGAVSIARRLQDPLAELVKIDPQSIGVGQYQHDLNQKALNEQLKAVVEDCVNTVGVDLNTASPALLAYVSGLNRTVADNIVSYRNQYGPFASRKALKAVPRLGDKAFELAAGFLRIREAANPLDNSAVHPEAYPIVEKIANRLSLPLEGLIGNHLALKSINPGQFVTPDFGLPSMRDLLQELDKPGRDPRGEFVMPQFEPSIQSLTDLSQGMRLEGVVTNVTKFGAFVDVGIHQEGLVHISMLANHFVADPLTVVRTGDIVQVTVMAVDIERKRISLSMRD